MATLTPIEEFELHAARAFFASAWADAVEESGEAMRGEIMDQMPSELDPAAVHAARTLRMDIERVNGRTVVQLMADIECNGHGDRPETMEYFGHYSAMQAMGHGVGLHDAFGGDVYAAIKVPYIEFGSHSLQRLRGRVMNWPMYAVYFDLGVLAGGLIVDAVYQRRIYKAKGKKS